jgi:hypothetical protein
MTSFNNYDDYKNYPRPKGPYYVEPVKIDESKALIQDEKTIKFTPNKEGGDIS